MIHIVALDIAKWNAASKRERDLLNQIFISDYGGKDISEQKDDTFDFNGTNINVMAASALESGTVKPE